MRHDDYCLHVLNNNNNTIMQLHSYDIIKIDNIEYEIDLSLFQYIEVCNYTDEKYNNMCISLYEPDTANLIERYSAQQFMDIIDKSNITYIKSLYLDWFESSHK